MTSTLTACLTSPAPRLAALGDPPRGSVGAVELVDGTRHAGELLALGDSSLVVLVGERVAVGPYAALAAVEWRRFSARRDGAGEWPSPGLLARGREASRFPYGITAEAWRALLASSRQAAPDTLRARPR